MDAKGSKRRQLIVDAKWQFHIWRLTAGAAIGAGVVYMLMGLGAVMWLPLETMSGSDIGLIALVMNLTFFGLLAALMGVVCLRLTHAVAGPAMILQRAIDGLRAGEYHHRCELRENDYLKDLATAVGQLQTHLEQMAASDRTLRAGREGGPDSTGELAAARGPVAKNQPMERV